MSTILGSNFYICKLCDDKSKTLKELEKHLKSEHGLDTASKDANSHWIDNCIVVDDSFLPRDLVQKLCEHDWWYLESIWEEGCAGAICIKCELIGCFCDAKRSGLTIEEFMQRRVKNSQSIDSRYIQKDKKRRTK
jgi:predicted small metal-binding protein